MEKEMLTAMAEWNLEMLKNLEQGVDTLVQVHKEQVAQVKELMDLGFERVVEGSTKVVEHGAQQFHKGTSAAAQMWTKAGLMGQDK